MAGKVYAFANQKGGVGKTTSAVNLAACLAEAGERALVVDLDRLARVAGRLTAEPGEAPPGFALLLKTGPTPAGFPRRIGVARKRPLA